ncbi:MAG: type IV secretion system protein [Synergistaceae bacterium]|nr:type IV secretion system protein [Synergistaceae bacterium]
MKDSRRLAFSVYLGAILFFYFLLASRADASLIVNAAMSELHGSIMDALGPWIQKAGEIALQLLAVTAVIGFSIGLKDLVLAGNLTMDSITALLVRYAFIAGLLSWLLSQPLRLNLIARSIKTIGLRISGEDISFGSLMTLFDQVTAPLVDFTNGLGLTDMGVYICMTFIIFLINCLFFMISATVLVVELESVFILIGGLFTASFFIIGYFRDYFLSYVRALVAVGVKMLLLCLCLGVMRRIMGEWPQMIHDQLASDAGIFSFLTPMSCALMGFYMVVKAVPQFAASILTGAVSGMDGGAVKAAAAAGYGLGATVASTSRTAAQTAMKGVSVLQQALQSFQHTQQAAKDTGSTPGQARTAGAAEALKTVMAGPRPGGPRAAGEQIYSDHARAREFGRAPQASAKDAVNAMTPPTSPTDKEKE